MLAFLLALLIVGAAYLAVENLTRKKENMTNREQIDAGIADLNDAIAKEKQEIQHKIDLMNIRITELENAAGGDYAPEIQAIRNAAAEVRAFVNPDEPIPQPAPVPAPSNEDRARIEAEEAKAKEDMIVKAKNDEADAAEKARAKQEADAKIKDAEADAVVERGEFDKDIKARDADEFPRLEPSPESTPVPGSKNDQPIGEPKNAAAEADAEDKSRADADLEDRARRNDDGSFSDVSK